MSSIFSVASAASASDLNGPGCEPLPSARSIPTAGGCSPGTGQMSLFSETSEPLPPKLLPTPSAVSYGSNQGGGMGRVGPVRHSLDAMARKGLISSAAASPVRTSVSPERTQAWLASAAAYGRSTPELLANYDRATSSWRTSQRCLIEGWSVFSETWPRSGMMRNGIAYRLPPLVRLTDATEFGLWQTPVSDDAVDRTVGKFNSRGEPKLSAEVKMWPTPTGRDWKDGSAQACRNVPENGLLGRVVHNGTNNSGSLNPAWVEFLMGLPTGWTVLEPSATPSSRKSPKSSDGQS